MCSYSQFLLPKTKVFFLYNKLLTQLGKKTRLGGLELFRCCKCPKIRTPAVFTKLQSTIFDMKKSK